MTDFSGFKKGFCDCCDTKKKNLCRCGYIRDAGQFIDWEAFIEYLGGPEHDLKHCDVVYDKDANTIYVIEQKNLEWFLDEHLKPKSKESLTDELLDKCSNTKRVFESETKKHVHSRFFCSYDLNNIHEMVSAQNIERMIRNNYSPYFANNNILCDTCKNVANGIIYNTL